MGYSRILLARPVKVSSTDKAFTYIKGGTNILSIPEGIYGDIGSVYKAIKTAINTVDANFNLVVSDHKWYSTTTGGQYQVNFTSTMAGMLGFTASSILSGATGSYVKAGNGLSNHCWLSTYMSSDQEPWQRMITKQFQGRQSRTGMIQGCTVGDARYTKEFNFLFEPAYQVFASECTTSFLADRAFDTFIYNSMTVSPLSNDTANPRGFWIYYDSSDFAVDDDFSNNVGVNYLYSTSPDIKTLATVKSNYQLRPRAEITKGRDYYNVEFEAETMIITESYI